MKRVIAFFALALVLGGCGYDGSYRYECQDPEFWEEEHCNPPQCLVDGMCTENLIGFDPKVYDTTTSTVDTTPPAPEETVAP